MKKETKNKSATVSLTSSNVSNAIFVGIERQNPSTNQIKSVYKFGFCVFVRVWKIHTKREKKKQFHKRYSKIFVEFFLPLDYCLHPPMYHIIYTCHRRSLAIIITPSFRCHISLAFTSLSLSLPILPTSCRKSAAPFLPPAYTPFTFTATVSDHVQCVMALCYRSQRHHNNRITAQIQYTAYRAYRVQFSSVHHRTAITHIQCTVYSTQK